MIIRRPAATSLARAPRFATQQARPAVARGGTLQPSPSTLPTLARNSDRTFAVAGREVEIVGRNRRQR